MGFPATSTPPFGSTVSSSRVRVWVATYVGARAVALALPFGIDMDMDRKRGGRDAAHPAAWSKVKALRDALAAGVVLGDATYLVGLALRS